MSGDRSYWDQRHEPRSPHWSPRRGRGAQGHHRGSRGGRGSYSHHEDREQDGREEQERQRRAADAADYRKTYDRGQPSEYRDRRDNEKDISLSRDSSEHGSRRPIPKADSTPSTPTTSGLGDEFASAILALTDLAHEKHTLRLKRERARQDYEEAKLIYETGKPTHAQFPIEGERAKERYAKEKSAVEALEAKSKEAGANISATKTLVAKLYDGLLAKNAEDKTGNFVTLSRDVSDLKKNSDYHKNQLKQQQDQLREYRKSIKELEGMPYKEHPVDAHSAVDENTLLRIQSVETQLAAGQSSSQQLASRVGSIEKAQEEAAVQQKIQVSVANTSLLKLEPRIVAVEREQANMLRIQQNFEQVQRNVADFDEDLHAHDKRIKALESSTHAEAETPVVSAAPLDAGTTSSITQRIVEFESSMNTSITEVRASQDASDIAHGALIQNLNENISRVEGMAGELIKNIMALEVQQKATSDEQKQLLRRIGSLESDFVHLKPVRTIISTNGNGPESLASASASASPTASLQNGAPKSTFDWGPVLNNLGSEVADINRRLAETKQFEAGINMGIRNLDTRMNNIFTDNICKQMIGQLQAIYPNVGRAESHLADLKSRVALLERTSNVHTESIGYINNGQDAIRGMQQAGETKFGAEIANLSTAIDSIRESISTIQSQENVSQKSTLSNGQDTSLKDEMTERIDSLSENFKKHIEAVSKRLEAQIEGIEHLIEFDDDGKVQSVKEVIHILAENYGKMMGEFDALEHQVRLLKAGGASSRGANSPLISRAQDAAPSPSASKPTDSPVLTSTAAFRAKQSGKRSAPSSPSTTSGSQMPGQQAAKKQKGAFISDSD